MEGLQFNEKKEATGIYEGMIMKKEWSPRWVSSTQPRKQRKFRYNAPLHVRGRFMSAHLSPQLRERFGKRSIRVRKGDEAKVMRGSFKGKTGTVERVDLRKGRVFMEEIKVKKVDGSEVPRGLVPSSIMLTKLKLEDKKRQAILERKENAMKQKANAKVKAESEPKEEPYKPKPEKPAEPSKPTKAKSKSVAKARKVRAKKAPAKKPAKAKGAAR
jgi:large subunit ribosomal protein L24